MVRKYGKFRILLIEPINITYLQLYFKHFEMIKQSSGNAQALFYAYLLPSSL